jgi:hypothetical protein
VQGKGGANVKLRSYKLALVVVVVVALVGVEVDGAPQDAVVRIPSHGGSGTVIWTGPGKTLILSAGHMSKAGKVVVNLPHPAPGADPKPGLQIVAVDRGADLMLVQMHGGPVPYVLPVAPPGHRIGRTASAGYDNLRWPAVIRPAEIIGEASGLLLWTAAHGCNDFLIESAAGGKLLTRELPWHGRSGGPLIDMDAGVLVGVVSGYRGTDREHWREVSPGASGVYVSHAAVLHFLARHAPEAIGSAGPSGYEFNRADTDRGGRPWVSEYTERKPAVVDSRPVSGYRR